MYTHVYILRLQLFVCTIFCDFCDWRKNAKLSIYFSLATCMLKKPFRAQTSDQKTQNFICIKATTAKKALTFAHFKVI